MKTAFLILRSAVYAFLFIFFFGWLALQTRVYDKQIAISLPVWLLTAGIILMIIGGLLILYCVLVFIIHGKGTPAVFDAPRKFVALGPYAFVRNPMYIGGFIMLAGLGLYHLSVSIFILLILLFLFFHLFVVFYEEPTLTEKFGQSYRDYRKKIKRWIPKWK
jgi:protein-S-isoprenylcysteine O-methyltransferase Ste14